MIPAKLLMKVCLMFSLKAYEAVILHTPHGGPARTIHDSTFAHSLAEARAYFDEKHAHLRDEGKLKMDVYIQQNS